jgi:hypothetical protein
MSQRFASVANVEISFQIILSKSIRNQLLVLLLRSFHEVAQPQVAVGAGVVLHPLGLVVAGLHGWPENAIRLIIIINLDHWFF